MEPFEAEFEAPRPTVEPEEAAFDDGLAPSAGDAARSRAPSTRRRPRTTPSVDAEPTPTLLEDAESSRSKRFPRPSRARTTGPGRWYVVHTYAGYENKVKSNLASRVRSMNVEDRIFEVVIPMEDVIEFKNGRKVVVQKKVFPGYLLVRMGLDDDAWYVVRNTPGVTGFVGSGAKPTPLPARRSKTSSAPARRSRARPPRRRSARGSSTRWASRCGSSPARSPTSTA